jgi:hypothetical protein
MPATRGSWENGRTHACRGRDRGGSATRWITGLVVSAIALAVVGAGCGSSAEEESAPMKVAVITDVGGLNDKGFNALAYAGLKAAQADLGVEGRVFIAYDDLPSDRPADHAAHRCFVLSSVTGG